MCGQAVLRSAFRLRSTALLALLFAASAANGEGVGMGFHLYPKLMDAMSTSEGPIYYEEDRNPVYILSRIVVEGQSADDWVEAVETIATGRKYSQKNVAAWYESFRKQGDTNCPSEWQVLAQDKKTITFERRSPSCGEFGAQHALYRVIYGRHDVFTIIATRKGDMDTDMRQGWLAVLDSAVVQ